MTRGGFKDPGAGDRYLGSLVQAKAVALQEGCQGVHELLVHLRGTQKRKWSGLVCKLGAWEVI